MFKGKKIVAIITARIGSKRLVGKNIEFLLDKPLVCWSIEQALLCDYIDRTIVSTDDVHIAAVAQKWGAEVLLRECQNGNIKA